MLDYIIAIGSITTPVVVIILGWIGWRYQKSVERKLRMEENLRDDRMEIYNQILKPFIILLMSETAWSSDAKNKNKDKNKTALLVLLSLEYRITSFKLSLVGSDPVVKTFSKLLQYSYEHSENNPKEILSLLGDFLLEIRKSMGK